MKVINKSHKIIGIGGEPLLPGRTMELTGGQQENPVIAGFLKSGTLADASKDVPGSMPGGISDFERQRIADEAVAKYKKEQEELASAQAERQAEAREVKNMKKDELLKKAAVMGLDVRDDDTVDTLKEKILAVLNQ